MNTIAQILQSVDTGATARSLYLHIPFCFHKCHYCDFYSLVDSQDRQAAFVDRLVRELECLGPFSDASGLRTLFVGGGTPTLLKPPHWRRLLRALHQTFQYDPQVEFTVEANPETVARELVDTLREGGVNRISIGCQTFNPRHLKTLERWHDPANVPRALELARQAGIQRTSLDLIFGIPGQTLSEWEDDLDHALALQPEHLSCYGLTFEPGTAMTARREAGTIDPIDEDLEAEMFLATRNRMRAAGYLDYEISNFARPGGACRHNLVYWENENWLAAGPSASGHLDGLRWKVLPHLAKYLASDGPSPLLEFEHSAPATAIAEGIMLGLRLAWGIDLEQTRRRIAEQLVPAALPAFDEVVAAGCATGDLETLAASAARGLRHAAIGSCEPATGATPGPGPLEGEAYLRLTDAGRLLADSVIGRLMHAVDPPTRLPLAQLST